MEVRRREPSHRDYMTTGVVASYERRLTDVILGGSFLCRCTGAALFGFGGIASAAAGIAKLLFFLFLIVFVVMLVLGLMSRGRAV